MKVVVKVKCAQRPQGKIRKEGSENFSFTCSFEPQAFLISNVVSINECDLAWLN